MACLFFLDILFGLVLLVNHKRPEKTAILEHLPEPVRNRIIAGASRHPVPWWSLAAILALVAAAIGLMLGRLAITAALLVLFAIFTGMAIREAKSIRPRGVHGYLAAISTDGRLHHCLACNYNLRGTVSATCPECGEAVLIDDLLRPHR